MSENIYYVYGLINPKTKLPFYIGKGKNNRAKDHLFLRKNDSYNKRKKGIIKKLLNENLKIDIEYYFKNLSNKKACQKEKELIKKYGRIGFEEDGILTNLTKGGEGGDTSMFFTEETRKKLKENSSGVNNVMSKLTKEQVLEIYYSIANTNELSKKYNVCKTQITEIKRKIYYKDITKDIKQLPGETISKIGRKRQIIPIDIIKNIYLESGTFGYFKEKYNIKNSIVKNIKERKTYSEYTQNLGQPGEIIKNSFKFNDEEVKNFINLLDNTKESYHSLGKKFGCKGDTIKRYIDRYKLRKQMI